MTSQATPFRRSITRIDNPTAAAGHALGHRARRLIDGGEAAATDPFLLMAEDWMPRGAFPLHPHRGIETVTFVVEGEVEHFDNSGHRGFLRSGDAQWMTAGRGVLHREDSPDGIIAHTLQLWVNLPASAKMTEPRYQYLAGGEMPVRKEPGVEARVFSGRSGAVVSSTLNHAAVTMIDLKLKPGAVFTQAIDGADAAFLFVLQGEVSAALNRRIVPEGGLAWLDRPETNSPSEVVLSVNETPARLLLFAGRPIGEPVVFGGPFVMNTHEEIRQAFADYRTGRF